MNTIREIALSRLKPASLEQTGTSLTGIVEPLMSDAYIARQVYRINDALRILMEIANTPQASELTDDIRETDADLDELLLLCEDDLLSTMKKRLFHPVKADAAEDLMGLFEKRDRQKLMYGGYAEQGKEIRTLFLDIFSDVYSEARNQSGAAQYLDALKAKYAELEELLEIRRNEKNLPSTTREQRGILRYRISKLLAYLDSNILDNIEGYRDVETPVNDLITDVMSKYRARTTREENQNLQDN